MANRYDYIIVGAGSAGCVLANRLSADPKNSVLLLEAGGDDRPTRNVKDARGRFMIHVPVGFAENMANKHIDWGYRSEPEPGTNGRVHDLLRGKVLGGCSSINGMVYVRGQPEDYDNWRQLGAVGWSWDDVLPYFRKAQHQERGEDATSGVGGPLNVSSAETGGLPISQAITQACEATGLPLRRDINNGEQEGVAYVDLTIRNGRRQSTAVAYLHPALHRLNLDLLTDAQVERVLFEDKRAVGVCYLLDGKLCEARADREIILCGGTYNSPQLLELSGIGHGERLQQLGIQTLVHSPDVGENLQDHVLSVITHRLKPHVTSINEMTRGVRLAGEVLKYAATGKGLLARGSVELVLFAKSREGLASPDIQMHITPGTKVSQPGRNRVVAENEPGLTFAPCHLRPESRGFSHIQAPDGSKHPKIQLNYLTALADQDAILSGMRLIRRIAAQPMLADCIAFERAPGEKVESDEAMMAFIRASASPVHHPVGTCRMGADPRAVVDPQLRVQGVEGLRVVDGSIMPRLVSGNTNAPIIMIAEKASDMILQAAKAESVPA